MIRPLLLSAFFAVAASAASNGELPAAHFDTRLSPENRIRQALNRLTFGARPGDVEQVRKLGVEKWIELQLHPDRIPQNPVLEERLKPLDSLRMDVVDLLKTYYPQYPPGMMRPVSMNDLLPPEQMRQIYSGTAEERRAAIEKLDPEKRWQVVAQLPPNVLQGLPDIQKEQEAARLKQGEKMRAEQRRVRPPLNELLKPEQIRIANRGTREERAALFASLDIDTLNKVAASLPPNALDDQPALRRLGFLSRQPQQAVQGDLREAKLYRAIYSNRQLEEVLTDFWFNHFNVYVGKGQISAQLAAYERDAIRPHILGKFQDILLATARHPAMLLYLDNWESMSPDVFQIGPFAPGPFVSAQQLARQARGLNENYGRELLELHTLGVKGGYTQQDVVNVARCFTGWTIKQPNVKPEFTFAAFMHDTGEKTVLGHKIAAGGEQDGVEVIQLLSRHPSTARFISTKLARRFVADDPPPALIDRMAKTFLKTDGDIRAVLETMFTSREFFSEGAWTVKVKSPLETVVSAVRALDGEAIDTFVLAQKVADMGQPLYGKEFPTGYKDTADAWLSTANVIARINFANQLANNEVHGIKIDATKLAGQPPVDIARAILQHDPSSQTLDALAHATGPHAPPANPSRDREGVVAGASPKLPPQRLAAIVLSSPEFQRR
jgi:uncharacterized protein (DUF1800 family)